MALLTDIKEQHGITTLDFFASTNESGRNVASDDATGIIFITTVDFDPELTAHAYLATDGDDFSVEADEVIYWVTNKAGTAKFSL